MSYEYYTNSLVNATFGSGKKIVLKMRNGNPVKVCVSEIRIKQMCAKQYGNMGCGVFKRRVQNFASTLKGNY